MNSFAKILSKYLVIEHFHICLYYFVTRWRRFVLMSWAYLWTLSASCPRIPYPMPTHSPPEPVSLVNSAVWSVFIGILFSLWAMSSD